MEFPFWKMLAVTNYDEDHASGSDDISIKSTSNGSGEIISIRINIEKTQIEIIRLTPKSARFSGTPPVPISLDALPVFRRWISDAAMNRCTARHTSGQQPVR